MTVDYVQEEEEVVVESENDFDDDSTYFVVPMESDDGFLRCRYCSHNWVEQKPGDLKFHWQHQNGNFVKIIRPHNKIIEKRYGDIQWLDKSPKRCPDLRYHLFAAVARTRRGREVLPNVFHALDNQIIVPALGAPGKNGHRALVLIFSRYDKKKGQFHLRSTSDPIIKPDPVPPPKAAPLCCCRSVSQH